MSTALIAITTHNTTNATSKAPKVAAPKAYLEAVVRAGAIPVLLPLGLPENSFRELYTRFDGVIFTGGGDIEIEHFDGEPHPEVGAADAERDRMELHLARWVVDRSVPFLGICRGLQVINVALGGSLYTHISGQLPDAVEHCYYPDWPRDHIAHTVQVVTGSRLHGILNLPNLEVNSLHHQGIRSLAPGLKASGLAPDGLIEAVELPGHPFGLAVQWHPESLPDDAATASIFTAFVQAAQDSRS